MRYRKVVKTNGTETSRYDYVYSDGRLVVITYTANGVSKTARFIYDSYGEVRGFILDNSASYLYLKNAQGDITAIVDENGAVILTCTYDAWGVVTFGATSMESMALAAELSKINPFTYRGYCYDYDIEMYYLQSRYYDPEICRFINADSTDYLGATGTLLSYNLFAYCENDPVGSCDFEGKASKSILGSVNSGFSLSNKGKTSIANAKSDLRYHLKNVVNVGYVETNRKQYYNAVVYKKSYNMNNTKYYKRCKQVYKTLCTWALYLFGINLNRYTWYGLSNYRRNALLNEIQLWDKDIVFNVARYYGGWFGAEFIKDNLIF